MINLVCETPYEKWRADHLFTKEPGTVAWIQRECKPGDVFFDVGANIGQYSLMAARQVMPGGAVVAFEPHLGTAVSLLRNIAANKAQVEVITSALHERPTFVPFYYKHMMAGSSGSQLGHNVSEVGERFEPEARELKHATSLDYLLATMVIPRPSLIKIDVDGNELAVLRGLNVELISDCALRSVQVEVHPSSYRGVTEFMAARRWKEIEMHHTAFGQAEIDNGANPEKVFRNVIYGRS